MAKTKNSSKIIAIISAIILFLSLAFAIIPNLDNSTSTQVQASTLTEAQLQQRRNAPGLYQTGTTTLITSWADLISDGIIVVNNTTDSTRGTIYVPYSCGYISGDLVCGPVDNLTSLKKSFNGCENLVSIDMSNWNTSNVTSWNSTFSGCRALKTIIFDPNFDTSKVTDMGFMFSSCSSLTNLDVSGFDTSKVTSMSSMFSGCGSLTSLDVSNFDTSKVTSMSSMFYNCRSLTSLDVSSFDTSKVTSMMNMFSGSKLTSLAVGNFDTSNVTTMDNMFENCSNLIKLDLSNFRTSKVKFMYYMFSGCSNLEKLYLNNFTISSETATSSMFSGCSNLKFIKTPQAVANKTFSDLSLSFESAVDGMTGEDIASSDYMPTNTFICFNGYQPTVEDTGVATDLFSLAVTGIIIIALAVVCFKKKKFN